MSGSNSEPSTLGEQAGDTEPGPDAVDAVGVARDASTVTEILDGMAADGYTGQFIVVEGAALRCATCRTTTPAADFTLASMRRTEGASDPDDMLAIVALTCPSCQTAGTAVANYGPQATQDESELLLALERPAP